MADANINIGVNVNSKSLSQLEAQLASLNAQIKQVPIGSAKFKQLTAEFQSVSKSIEGASAKLKGFNPEETFGKLAKVAGGVGAAFAREPNQMLSSFFKSKRPLPVGICQLEMDLTSRRVIRLN